MTLEALALARFSRLPLKTIVAAILPGALIVLALRASLVGADWRWIALALLSSWPVHFWDLVSRTPQAAPPPSR